MPSVSGLSRDQRIQCRDRVVQAALLAVHNNPQVHFSMDVAHRWDGIANHRNARLGQLPTHADDSSFATWCLWNGLFLGFGLGDLVSGAGWTAGNTGTMLSHGKPVRHLANVRRGDCVFYGSGPPGRHVTIVVGKQGGVPVVVSHASEQGPFSLIYNYRHDVMGIRRYI